MQQRPTYPQRENHDFDRFYRENERALRRFVAYRVSDVEAQQDLVAEIVCQTLVYCRRTEGAMLRRALLYKIARNRLADYYEERQQRAREIAIEDAPPLATRGALDAQTDARQDLALALQALEDLRDEYREVILLHVNVGLSIAEIAELMERQRGAIRVLLFRARRALAAAMQRRMREREHGQAS